MYKALRLKAAGEEKSINKTIIKAIAEYLEKEGQVKE
jgi:hypothetical protein